MAIDPEIIGISDRGFLQFIAFIESLTPTDEETGRFYHIVSALAWAARTNYKSLRNAFDEDEQTIMAWSCRNLLEVRVFTKYVLESTVNADEFAADRLIDALQIGNALKKLGEHLNPSGAETSYDADIHRIRDMMKAEGVVRTSFLSTRDLARQVGLVDEFDTVNKVCSKFVHPTAWSVLTADIGSARFPHAGEIFFISGAHYFAAIFGQVRRHIDQWGLKHKP